MKFYKSLPHMGKPVRENRGDEIRRCAPCHFGYLLQVGAERGPLLVRLGKPEVVLRVSSQCFLEGSKKPATFPIAVFTWSRNQGNSVITPSTASGV